ncbi:putative acyltransferase [Trypanosoma conorhini]|uniref:Putative acyltransferase n=1 Tax=Trypanosoma conorhini TaxID=83891 RepID=A0A3R7NST5_9TRYP|nr:putative acyltransferase [Trypanosoma conorhini]RNF26521.1 putative acyltransferase [Trypanosoma conorhini]
MIFSQYLRLPLGLLVFLVLCTQIFGPPVAEEQISESIRSITAQYFRIVERSMNDTVRSLIDQVDSNGDGQIQLEEVQTLAFAVLQRVQKAGIHAREISRAFSHITWTELFWRYLLLQLLFLFTLFIVENLRCLIFTAPRRLLLDDSYLTATPPEVGPEIALKYDTPWTPYERLKLVFFAVTGLLFLRIFCVIFFAVLSCFIMTLCSWRGRTRLANPLWFTVMSTMACLCVHVGSVFAGVYHVKVFGHVANPSECKILIGNHSCVMEVFVLFMLGNFPSFVTRKENCEKAPFFADIAEALRAIVVDRGDANSRQATAVAISARAKDKDPNAPQLLVFPEGTTSNQRALFMFKKGAMVPGEPLQMICVSFPYEHFNPCWTGRACGGNNFSDLLVRLCSQFVNHLEVRALPVYTPTEEERKDPVRYAKHCQQMMASVLRCGVSSCTYGDYESLSRRKPRA